MPQPAVSGFAFRLAHQGHQIAEENGRCDAAGGCGDPSGEGTQKTSLLHRCPYALGQQVAKAGEGDGSACAAKLYHIFVEPQPPPSTTPETT